MEEPGLRPGKGKEVKEESSRPGDERPVPNLKLAFSAMSLSARMWYDLEVVNIKGAAVNIKDAAVNIKGAALPGGGHRPQRLRGQVVEIMNENVRHFLSAINMSCDCSLHQIKFPAATLLKTKSYL